MTRKRIPKNDHYLAVSSARGDDMFFPEMLTTIEGAILESGGV